MAEKWRHVGDLMHEINKDNSEVFNDNVTYHYFRRFKKELPFNFDKYVNDLKKVKKTKFIKRSDVLKEIFLSFSTEVKEDVVNYYLYKFHQHKVSRRRLLDLEKYLDDNREDLFKEDN
jgi:hypothetical protein